MDVEHPCHLPFVPKRASAGVTGSGFIVLASTLSALRVVPVEGVALLLGVDRFMSEARAITNLIGNAVATVVVAKSEKGFENLFCNIAQLQELKPSFVSVTYGAGGSTRERTHDLIVRIHRETSLTAVSHLTKVGTGTLILSGNTDYSGTTTINGGTLLVNGTHLPNASVTGSNPNYVVNSGATLGGTGTIGNGSPAATRICSSTRSRPVTSSVTGCSTCRRVFISRK